MLGESGGSVGGSDGAGGMRLQIGTAGAAARCLLITPTRRAFHYFALPNHSHAKVTKVAKD
jgi:hypothetical protein